MADAVDPSSEWTGTWRDPMNPSGADPENALSGTMFMVDAPRSDTISVSSDYSKLLFWANTAIANLQPGQSIQLAPGSFGYEWDVDLDNGFRPAGLIDLSSTSGPCEHAGDQLPNGSQAGNATHNLTLYRAPSGALVFSAGTIFWPDALDSHNTQGITPDPNVQQAMVNLLAQMGIQPHTLQSGLVVGVLSNDHTAPQATINPLSTCCYPGQYFRGQRHSRRSWGAASWLAWSSRATEG